MFKDEKEQNFFNGIARAIAEEIGTQVFEIEELDGHFELDFTQITFDSEKRCICVDTDFINMSNGKRYVWNGEVNMYRGTYEFCAKVFYMFLKYYAEDFEHGVNFSGNA